MLCSSHPYYLLMLSHWEHGSTNRFIQMKTLRFIGMAIIAVIMSVNFMACGDDDEEEGGNAASLVGKWKIEKINEDGETLKWDGYPYFVLTEKHLYFTDDNGETKSDYSTYTYDADKKIINASYVNQDNSYTIEVLKLTDSEFHWQWDDEGIITFYCKKVN